jgi:magnesium transporter
MVALKRDVLDRQIIDTQGRKVVRVNDIALEEDGGRLFLRRVDIGLAGAVRRLLAGLVAPRFIRRLAEGFPHRDIRWDYVGLVDPRSATIRLKVHQQLARLHPADLADIIEDLGRVERQAIVSTLDLETAAQALSETEPEVQAAVVEQIEPDRAADLLEEMPPDEAADILGDLTEERSQAVLEAMEEDEAEDVRELLTFNEDSAGGLMTTEFFRAAQAWTVGDVLEALRELDEVPVVTEDGKLVGMAPLVRLVRVRANALVTAACREETPWVRPSARFKEVLGWFEKYHLHALAVVDEFDELLGVINVEDVMTRLARKR